MASFVPNLKNFKITANNKLAVWEKSAKSLKTFKLLRLYSRVHKIDEALSLKTSSWKSWWFHRDVESKKLWINFMGFIFLFLSRLFAFSLVCWKNRIRQTSKTFFVVIKKSQKKAAETQKSFALWAAFTSGVLCDKIDVHESLWCQATLFLNRLRYLIRNESKKVSEVLEHVFSSGGRNEKPEKCVHINRILPSRHSLVLFSHPMKLNNEEFSRETVPMAF